MTLTFSSVIDLTHRLAGGIPTWPGDPLVEVYPLASIGKEGYWLQEVRLCEHSGTHFGSSAHFRSDGLFADDLPPDSFIRTAVMIDISSEVEADSDCRLTQQMIEAWERTHGRVPEDSIVLLQTGWSRRWSDPPRYIATDENGVGHYPGFGLEAARFLAGERGVVGLGIDTPGIDAGTDEALSVNDYWLRGERFHLENLTNLDRLPATGFTLVIGVLKIARSSGGPARVLAMV
jgi:kynurenine formamidase